MQFVIYSDNSGQFHWRLDNTDGNALAFSGAAFTSAAAARRAAADVHDHAGAAGGTDRQ
jgi:uncharacterized protein YegP (UPF0339 family)